eukprot:5840737-Alexandrium_andersonii.AAC.1
MSASLVGSEMCIRDRREIPRGPKVREGFPCRVRLDARHANGCPANSSPVSYTHLTLPTICSV